MTIEKTCVQCDTCENILVTGLVPFNIKRNKIREAGWVTKKVGLAWKHICKDCNHRVNLAQRNNYWWNND